MNEKMFLIFSLFIFISVGTFGQDQQNFVKYTIIYENFDIRRISSPADPTGPNAIAFDIDGNLFITNPLGRQIFKFNNTFGYEETLSLERDMFGLKNADTIYYRNGNVWGNSGNHISLIRKSENRKYQIDIVNLQSKYILRQNAFYLTENYFFHYLVDGGIICIPHPGMSSKENLSKILKNEEVLALFEPGSGNDMDGLTMDDKYRLFRDGKLVNRDYYNWMDYWMDQYGYYDPREFNLDTRHKDIPLWRNGYNQAYYMGDDANGNSYWRSLSNYIYVFNDNGWCIKEIKYNDFYHLPTVHPNGDIYFMKWGEEQNSVDLYKIPNTWALFDWQPPAQSTNSTAKVTANGLRMRDNPVTTNSTVVASLNEGTIVEILGQSATEETIGGNTAYWYRIRTPDGQDGWVFGAFLEMQ